MDVDAINSLARKYGNRDRIIDSTRRLFQVRWKRFSERLPHHVTPRKGNGKNCERSKSRSKSIRTGKRKEGKGDGKTRGTCNGLKSAKGSYTNKRQIKIRRKSHMHITLTMITLTILRLTMAGVMTSEMITGSRFGGFQCQLRRLFLSARFRSQRSEQSKAHHQNKMTQCSDHGVHWKHRAQTA